MTSWTFEDSSTWFTGPNWTVTNSTARAHSGTRSLLLTRNNATSGNGYTVIGTTVTAGVSYSLTFWTFASAATQYSVSIDGGGSRFASSFFTPVVGLWQQQAMSFTPPAGVTSVSLFFTDDPNASPTSGSTLNLDDVSVVTSAVVPPPTSAVDYRGWSVGAGWRYLAQRIDGSGQPGAWMDTELPLRGVSITDTLSGPPQLSASIEPVLMRARNPDGTPLLDEWATVIHAENDGSIRGSFILVGSSFDGSRWNLDCSGFSGYAKGMAYDSQATFIQADPLDIVRHIWASIQATSGSNLGLLVDAVTKTSARVGTDPILAESGSGEKPYRLEWWSTHDLGGEIDKLAGATPFDYRERHVWNTTRTEVRHYLDFGFPSLGFRRTDLRFILGGNIQTTFDPNRDGEDFANHVRMLGAGEGSEMMMAESRRADGRLRRMAVVDDKSITDKGPATIAARMELARRNQLTQVTEVAVRNTPSAPFGSFGVGDEIRVQGELDWMTIDLWCRVVQVTITPDQPDMMTMRILRTDWLV